MSTDDLPNDIAQLKRMIAELSATVGAQHQQLTEKEHVIVELLRRLRGTQRERVDPNQLLLFEAFELESVAEDSSAEPSSPRRRQPHGRRRLPDDLPREERIYEVPEAERLCPHDGQPMQLIGYETSEQLEYVPPKLKVIVHRRAKYACPVKHDEAKLITAPKPPQPIERGLPGPGLLAALVVGKFGDHLPGYRLEDIFSRHGVDLRRSVIYDWLAAMGDLTARLVERMKELLLQSKVVHTDDTSVKLVEAGFRGTRTARFWAYVGDSLHPYTVYDFTDSRKRDGPQSFLKNFRGYLQADAYGGYDGIYLASQGTIVEVACWAHCRRYWFNAREQDPPRAHHVLAVIRQLYDVERKAAQLDAADRHALRQEHAAPLLTRLDTWLGEQASQLLPKSLIGKAHTYTRNQWAALNRYLEDGDVSIDNNLSERTVKPIAIGRKGWLFVGSMLAGHRAAALMSLVASCKANRVEPWAYLTDLFTQLPAQPDLDTLLPNHWLTAHPEHRWHIADRRAEERHRQGRL